MEYVVLARLSGRREEGLFALSIIHVLSSNHTYPTQVIPSSPMFLMYLVILITLINPHHLIPSPHPITASPKSPQAPVSAQQVSKATQPHPDTSSH